MGKLLLTLCSGLALLHAADDSWSKVKAIARGTEIRIYKKGSVKPLQVKMDEANDEHLIYLNKNEQTSIDKDDVERVDARPSKKRVTQSETTNENGAVTGGNLSIGNRPDYELVYQRPARK